MSKLWETVVENIITQFVPAHYQFRMAVCTENIKKQIEHERLTQALELKDFSVELLEKTLQRVSDLWKYNYIAVAAMIDALADAFKAEGLQAQWKVCQKHLAKNLTAIVSTLKLSSMKEDTQPRRQMLDDGKAFAERAVCLLDEFPELDTKIKVDLQIETGLFYVECARETVEESDTPIEMLPEAMQAPQTRLNPNILAKEFRQGMLLMSEGFETGWPFEELKEKLSQMRVYIVDMMKGLAKAHGNVEDDVSRLTDLQIISRHLCDDLLYVTAIAQLSTVLREAKRPAAAEQAIREALQWDQLEKRERNDLLAELASALSEQGKFQEAEQIQRKLLDDDI